VAVEATLDEPPWSADAPAPISFEAVDGFFSSEQEEASFRLETAGLAPGRHTLFLRAQDASGRWGAVSAVFLWLSERDTLPRRAAGRVG
jgi:hypothetical protein